MMAGVYQPDAGQIEVDGRTVVRPTTKAAQALGIARQQLVEIAKALSVDARIPILDEPTAALTRHETESLFRIVEDLRGRSLRKHSITAAIAAGVGHVPEDRKGQGLVLDASVNDNLGFATLASSARFGLADFAGRTPGGWLVLHPKPADEGDRVAVGIGQRRQLHSLVGPHDLARRQTAGGQFGEVPRQVVDGEVQQPGTGPLGIVGDLHPARVGDLPLDEQPGHRQIVRWPAEDLLVPGMGGVEIGHGNDGQQVCNRQGGIRF
jgi:hypothetical protein